MGLVGPLHGDCVVWHSVRGNWTLLQSQTTWSLPQSPTLAPSVTMHYWFRWSTARLPLYRSKLNRMEPQRLECRTDPKSLLLGVVLLSLQEENKHFVLVPDSK